MATQFRIVGAGKTFLSPTDFFVQANTNDGGQVEIVLPNSQLIFENINNSNTPYNYIGVRFVDISNNASVNNIVIYGFDNDLVNGGQTLTLNTNGAGGIITLIGEGQWSFEANSTSGGGGGTPTLQQVLDFNHDLVDGNNFQGTGAGVGNTKTNVIALGTQSAYFNTGKRVTALGSFSAYCNIKDNVIALGYASAYCNTGDNVTASGYASANCNTGNSVTASGRASASSNSGSYLVAIGNNSAYCNTGNNVTASGYNSAFCNTGQSVTAVGYNSASCNTGGQVTASGYSSAYCNTGNYVTASGYRSAYLNTGDNVIFLGQNAGFNVGLGTSNSLSNVVGISNVELPQYVDYTTASASINVLAGGVSGTTYLFYNTTTCAIEGIRL
jgi:hypothetical protein